MRPHVLGLLALLPHGGTMVGPRVHLARPSAAAARSTGVSCAAAPKARLEVQLGPNGTLPKEDSPLISRLDVDGGRRVYPQGPADAVRAHDLP